MSHPAFQLNRFMIRKKVLKLFGEAFHIYDEQERVVMYSKLKAFKLKEDIRIYTGEDMAVELLTIKARSVLDFASAYDVVDAQSGEKVGVLKRKAFKSILRDEWILMDAHDREIGKIQEDNIALALLRRFVTNLIPQSFTGMVNEIVVSTFNRRFNPFILKMDLDFSADPEGLLDRRLGVAAGILLSAIEGRQSD